MRCSFTGCEKEAHSRGLCVGHYRQQRVGEELRPLRLQFHGLSEKDRFMKWVSILPNGCWRWTGSTKKSKTSEKHLWHGQWRNAAGEIELSHRGAWRMLVGPVPSGMYVLHRCDIPRCVNPEHLFIGTQADNIHDMWDKGRARPGVSRGSDHGMSKLTEELVREIRATTESGPVASKRLGISTTTFYDVRNRKIWRHVK